MVRTTKEEDQQYADVLEFHDKDIIYTMEVVRFKIADSDPDNPEFGFAPRVWQGYPLTGDLLNRNEMSKWLTRDEAWDDAWEFMKAFTRKK